MKYATIRDGLVPAVITADGKHAIPINEVLGTSYGSLVDFIRDFDEGKRKQLEKASASNKGIDLAESPLTAPIPRPVHDVVCVGINYAAHLEEHKAHLAGDGFKTPPKAVYFGKRAIRITGPDEEIDGHPDLDERLDYEAELAVVIKDTIDRNTEYGDIGNHIFGFSTNMISPELIRNISSPVNGSRIRPPSYSLLLSY